MDVVVQIVAIAAVWALIAFTIALVLGPMIGHRDKSRDEVAEAVPPRPTVDPGAPG